MPPAYIITNLDVIDMTAFKKYQELAPAVIARFGGEYIVRGGSWTVLEGVLPRARVVVLKFPSFEAARTWYDSEAYTYLKRLRQMATVTNMLLVEGV